VDAERRQVTVLFTDMVGFTSFSERSGEEAAYTLMRSLSKLMDDAVREQGGVVQGFTGDGVMAVFGAPVALEDARHPLLRSPAEIPLMVSWIPRNTCSLTPLARCCFKSSIWMWFSGSRYGNLLRIERSSNGLSSKSLR